MSSQSRREAASSGRRRPSRPSLRNQLLFVFGILFLAAGAFYAALVVATQIDQIFFPGSQIKLGINLPLVDKGDDSSLGGGGRINVLVVGIDKRPNEADAASRTDTIMVLSIDPSTNTARGLGIPRDLYVDIRTPSGNSTYKERINAAYVLGESPSYEDYDGGGIGLMENTVENLLGLEIDYYVMIDFEGFKQIIDLLGGIDVDVPNPINDPYYSETELLGDFYPCIFDPGVYHMDGSDALCYARTRRNSSDLDRILRQQRIIFAVMDKASQLNVLADPGNVVNLWKRYKDTIKTDISDFQIPGFAALAAKIKPEQLSFLSLGAATTPFTTSEGAAVLLPSEAGIKQIVDAFTADNNLIEEAASVEIQNGSGIEGQASKAKDYFTSLGIPEASLVAINAATTGQAETVIIDFSGKSYTAARLADWMELPASAVRKSTPEDEALRTSPDSDIVVILGTDARLESELSSTEP